MYTYINKHREIEKVAKHPQTNEHTVYQHTENMTPIYICPPLKAKAVY